MTETCLSQWYPCQFEVDGVTYTSAEQYMMAEKARLFGDEKIRTEILSISDPRTCKALGRKVKNFDKAVWDKKKEDIVRNGNFEKFMQNDALRNFSPFHRRQGAGRGQPNGSVWGISLGKIIPMPLIPKNGEDKIS